MSDYKMFVAFLSGILFVVCPLFFTGIILNFTTAKRQWDLPLVVIGVIIFLSSLVLIMSLIGIEKGGD